MGPPGPNLCGRRACLERRVRWRIKNLINVFKRGRLRASSVLVGAALLGLAATQATAQEDAVSEIVVTGSRIPQPNLSSVSPIQVVGSQDVTLGGRPVTADILNQLPQAFQSAGTSLSSTSNPLSGPGGVATIDLRSLGQTRTLVLVDGRRLGIGDPNTGNPNPSPDINQIPSQLIDRVEVLTGGASATYGSDAVAGVVNFVMKRNFEGVQMDGRFGVYQHDQHNETVSRLYPSTVTPPKDAWDGKSRDLSLIMGTNSADGNGNVTAYVTWHNQDPVTQGKRDYSACQVNVSAAGVPRCAGSANSNYFESDFAGPFSVSGNVFVPNGTPGTTPPALFNSNAYSYLLQQSTRWNAGFMAHYEVNQHFTPYADFSFMNDTTNVQIAPTGLFLGGGASVNGYLVNCNNPFLSGSQRTDIGCTPAMVAAGENIDLAIGRRNIEGGGRNSFYEHTNYRALLGARGDLVGSWKYDLYGSYYRTTINTASENYLAISKIAKALQVVQGPNGPVCIDDSDGCVPYNIFQDGGVTQAALDYLDVTGTARGVTTEQIVEANITGDLGDYGVKSPFARDGVGISFGGINRRDTLGFFPDVAQLSGDLSGSGGDQVIVDNSIRVTEAYGETRIPLAQDMAFAKELAFEGGIRYSDYSTGIKATTYKLGLQWAPIEDIKFRGSFNRAIRAPNLLELYTPSSITNSTSVPSDPCAPTPATQTSPAEAAEATLEQCQRTGVTPAQYGNGLSTNTINQCPAGQCAVQTGGSTELEAEKSKSINVGFTLTPTMLPGLNASVDYYRIKLKGGIGTLSGDTTLQRCLDTGEQVYCQNIRRGPNGNIFGTSGPGAGYIVGTTSNIGSRLVSGLDFQLNYNLPLENWGWDTYGRVSLSFFGTRVIHNKTAELPGDEPYDCAGLFGPASSACDGLSPKWRHTARLTWTTPWDVQASLAWRYIGGVTYYRDTDEPSFGAGTTDLFNHTLPARTYIDLSGTWTVNDMVTFRAGVNNIFDQDPPLVNSAYVGTGFGNTFPTYDLLGRQMFIGFTANF